MSEFNIGDRVEAIVNRGKIIEIGDTGTICDFCMGLVGVEWDRTIMGGHDCDGHCSYGFGRYVPEETIELIVDDITEDSFLQIIS